jgi:hypothetical protein
MKKEVVVMKNMQEFVFERVKQLTLGSRGKKDYFEEEVEDDSDVYSENTFDEELDEVLSVEEQAFMNGYLSAY